MNTTEAIIMFGPAILFALVIGVFRIRVNSLFEKFSTLLQAEDIRTYQNNNFIPLVMGAATSSESQKYRDLFKGINTNEAYSEELKESAIKLYRGYNFLTHGYTALVIIGLWIALAFVLFSLTNLGSMNRPRESVDFNNPESVLNAYFGDWRNGNWSDQTSMMDSKYNRLVPEPMESIKIDSQKLLSSKSDIRTYAVSFDVKTKGQGVSMTTGHYDWTYELTRSAAEKRWLITNYGAG